MSYFTIPTDADVKFYDQQTQLEGVEYILEFYWSDRETCWYLNLYDQNQSLIIAGIKLVVNWPLLLKSKDIRTPPGRLICIDMSGQRLDIQQMSDLNDRVLLTYITSDDPDVALVDAIAGP